MGKKLITPKRVDFTKEEKKFQWYGVITVINHERKVAEMLEKRFESMGQSDKFKEVLTPIAEWTEEVLGRVRKDGTRGVRKVKRHKNLLEPGYIFINMIMTNETWGLVRNTSGVVGWLNRGDNRPEPVEVDYIVRLKEELGLGKQAKKELVENFEGKVGDRVKVIEGPFLGYEGEILSIKELEVSVALDPLGVKSDFSPSHLKVIK